jgi:hypothetical protein
MLPHDRARAGGHEPTTTRDAWVATSVRTHGTGAVASVFAGGPSHGCHRLLPRHAGRLATFLLRHHGHARDGPTRESWERALRIDDKTVVVRRATRGVRFVLEPPIPVLVLVRPRSPAGTPLPRRPRTPRRRRRCAGQRPRRSPL